MNIPVEESIGDLLRSAGLTLAVGESCTGGLVCHKVTSVSGSSEYFKGGVVAYSNDAKISALGVNRGDIEKHGAVSGSVAEGMANGARLKLRADIGLGITGIAGPLGGVPSKPVGTVFVALAHSGGVEARRLDLRGSRMEIKENSSNKALEMLKEHLLRRGVKNGEEGC